MPITPFHVGPGLALHSAAPRAVSFIAFCVANVLVDVEPLYYMLTGQSPLHRFFHTYAGVSLVVLATIVLFLLARGAGRVIPLPNVFGWKDLPLRAVCMGAALGGYSHVLLDSVMHADMRPFAPWSSSNPLWLLVSLEALHLFCLVSGLLGLAMLGLRWFVGRRRAAPDT